MTPLHTKIILFDLDGTLIDSTEAILESFAKAYEKCGGDVPSDESIKNLVGLPLKIMFVKLGVNEKNKMDYVEAYKEHYRTIHTQKTVLLPQVKEAIEKAHTFARLGVVTTKTGKYSRELLEYFDLMHYFEVLIGAEDVQNLKPHAEPILKALDTIGDYDKKKAYMIGDTISDILSAKEANITSIAVLCGYGEDTQLHQNANFVTKNTYDAVKLIEKR